MIAAGLCRTWFQWTKEFKFALGDMFWHWIHPPLPTRENFGMLAQEDAFFVVQGHTQSIHCMAALDRKQTRL